MPTPTAPQDKRYAISFSFDEWDLIECAMERIAHWCVSNSTDTTAGTIIMRKFGARACNRIVAKIRAEIPGIGK